MNKVLYVPLDERACNYDFPMKLAAMTDDIVLLEPPAEKMGFKKQGADVQALWKWVFENAPACSYAILSVDTLVYGNIINSRTHHKTTEECLGLLEHFRELKRLSPALKIHAFNLVARVAAYNSDSEDPDYWEYYGRDIWKYSFLTDKMNRGCASADEIQEYGTLKNSIPAEYLKDFLDRRDVDRTVNLACADLVQEGVFEILTVPKDDNAEYGYAAMDQMALMKQVMKNHVSDRVLVYPGADEVGSVLFARVFNIIKHYSPQIYVRYSSTFGPFIVPRYEDRPMAEGIKAQIHSIGGIMLDSAEHSDCMLAVNSPGKEMIESSNQNFKDITFSTHINLNEFFHYIRYYHENYKKPIGLAEVSVSNGCENDCMEMGRLTGSYDFLTAVGGWNTTENTIGVVLAQIVISSYYDGFKTLPEKLQLSRKFMVERLTTDWLYQSNVLRHYLAETADQVNPYALDEHIDSAVAYFRAELQKLLDQKFPQGLFGCHPAIDSLCFQWNGAFFIRLSVDLSK